MTTTQYQRLEELMDRRRVDLDLEWQDVARGARISVQSLRAVRRGESQPRQLTKRRLENVLDWGPGSIDRILDGGEPEPVGAEPRREARGRTEEERDLDAMAREALRFRLGREPSELEVARWLFQAAVDKHAHDLDDRS